MKRLSFALFLLASPSTAFADDWRATDTQKKALVAKASDYFAAIDRQDHPTLYKMLAPSMQKRASEAVFEKLTIRNRAQHGPVAKRKVAGVTWYPKGSAVGSGVAAAIDFSGSTETGNILCGYLVFIEMDAEQFVLLRADKTYISPAMASEMSESKRKEFFDRPGCRQFLTPAR